MKILLLSGIHGDEYGVISSVKKYLKKRINDFPFFYYISEVSPSAVLQKTRNNKRNIDLNRSFFDNSNDEEITTLKTNIKGTSFLTVFTFHEDCDRTDEFYMYSSHRINPMTFSILKKQFETKNIILFNGIDDPRDPILNNNITNGLLISPIEKEKRGTLWPWLHKNNNIKHCIDFEIPGKAPQQKKDILVQILFDYFISQYVNLFL